MDTKKKQTKLDRKKKEKKLKKMKEMNLHVEYVIYYDFFFVNRLVAMEKRLNSIISFIPDTREKTYPLFDVFFIKLLIEESIKVLLIEKK